MSGYLIVRAILLLPVDYPSTVFKAEWLMDYGGWTENPSELAKIFDTLPEAIEEANKLAEFNPVVVPISPSRSDVDRDY